MWGQGSGFPTRNGSCRIIPTRVGTRIKRKIINVSAEDHPHACGDKTNLCWLAYESQGSSPRVWGQDFCKFVYFSIVRIIPTRVGTRDHLRTASAVSWDHPHACGDKEIKPVELRTVTGSSPRVWGQERIDSVLKVSDGIIPTRVGTSMTYAPISIEF